MHRVFLDPSQNRSVSDLVLPREDWTIITLTCCKSTRAWVDNLLTKACSRFERMVWRAVASFCVQWLNRAGKRSASASFPDQTSLQKRVVSSSPSCTVVMARYKGRIARRVSQWCPRRSPFRFAKLARCLTHCAQAEQSMKCSRCTNLSSRQMFWVPKSLMPSPPSPWWCRHSAKPQGI